MTRRWRMGALTALAVTLGCGGKMREARPMTPLEARTFVVRPAPAEVPEVDGLSTIGGRVRVAAPPADVWQVLAVGFGEVANWAGAGISESECTSGDAGQLGAVRACRIADHMPLFGGDDYEERIIAWDEAAGYFAVLQTRATGPTELLVTENWISADGEGGAVVTQLVHMDLVFPATMMARRARSQFKRKLVEGLIGLRHYCETGERVTPRNWEAVVELHPQVLEDNEV